MDKFTATWISHTSISDFLKCPRAYYLNHVYKDPHTKHKVKLMNPSLALGQSVHEVVESLSTIPTTKRFERPLLEKYERAWKKIAGKKGGFSDPNEEATFFERGQAMLNRVSQHPGPVANLAVKIKQDLPYYWLSETDNIILCGKLDWLEYLPDQDAVHIIDFKTSKTEEDPSSLQLPIYYLLATTCQHRPVVKASYWYLNHNDHLTPKQLPSEINQFTEKLLQIGKDMKLARKLNRLSCPHGEAGCQACRPLEKIQRGEATFVGENEYHQDIYILERKSTSTPDSEIL